MTTWDGITERRRMHDCSQENRLIRIEEDINNHKEWRKDTSSILGDIHVQLATMNERLKSISQFSDERLKKYDDHVEEGRAWRRSVAGLALTMLLNIAGTIWWGATITADIHRLNQLHPYGSPIAPVIGDRR